MSLNRVPAALLERYGAPWTLRRRSVAAGANSWTDGSATVTFHAQRANERISEPNNNEGLVRDPGGRIVMSPDYEAPRKGDQCAPGTITSESAGIAWREIVHVHTVEVEGVVSRYVVQYRQ